MPRPVGVLPGAAPGSLVDDDSAPRATVRVFAYNSESLEEREVPVANLRRGDETQRLWVSVVGVRDVEALSLVGELFKLHPLALEDVNNGGQRPKLEDYEDYLFLVTRVLEAGSEQPGQQLSMFIGNNFVVSFQERAGDPFDPIRERLRTKHSRVRARGSDYLAYALLDAVVDHVVPLIDGYGDHLEQLEVRVSQRHASDSVASLFELRRELQGLKRTMMATGDAIERLRSHELQLIEPDTRTYLRDCHDHAVRAVETIDSWRDFCSGLMDLHYARSSQRLNQIMQVLTIISTIFIPLSFITGLYGMNFDRGSRYNMPELGWDYGYPAILGLMALMVVAQLVYFSRRGWLGVRR
ncbi:magnesium/cobalt transporter CorA [Plesiocystis pacifica]|uniref:magnesium/cobalt transporter CorA n=1 Tax=Plesiocystis pacifica TaxID=191768 RepID=UPI0005D483F0|nr:magnesium/cobalt transporter CorA [Plesiocystis pacifica]